jgi:hypothetical protein
MDDDETIINKGFCSAADVMQLALEKKLALQTDDKDMIVMLHEIEYENSKSQIPNSKISSSLVVKGETVYEQQWQKLLVFHWELPLNLF